MNKDSQLNVQVGGDHYRRMVMQPVEYAVACGLDFVQASVVKYVSRHRNKNGAEDLDKAIHLCMIGVEMGLMYDVSNGQKSVTEMYCRLNALDDATESVVKLVLNGYWDLAADELTKMRRVCYGE